MIKWFLDARKNEKEFIISKDNQYAQAVKARITDTLTLAKKLKGNFESQDNIALVEDIIISIYNYNKSFDKFLALTDQQLLAEQDMLTFAQRVQKECNDARNDQKQAMLSEISSANTIMFSGLIIAVIMGTILAFAIVRGISRSLEPVIAGLSSGSAEVASASSQVSSAGQQLAEGASEQAASIEESSSAIEEISAMTRQNAVNADEANTIMQETSQMVGNADSIVKELTLSMEKITQASEETQKIIKIIDEIAFQTNLLALNAAVEAARAGEAGTGFAVVADEVRNLAIRAADAAQNTQSLIEGTVKKVDDGTQLVTQTNETFVRVANSTSKVEKLVEKIATASNEQAQGIEQINKAVAEIDKITQRNAANAEEAASASEEMNALAVQMKSFVTDLKSLIDGKSDSRHSQGDQRQQPFLNMAGRHANPSPLYLDKP